MASANSSCGSDIIYSPHADVEETIKHLTSSCGHQILDQGRGTKEQLLNEDGDSVAVLDAFLQEEMGDAAREKVPETLANDFISGSPGSKLQNATAKSSREQLCSLSRLSLLMIAADSFSSHRIPVSTTPSTGAPNDS